MKISYNALRELVVFDLSAVELAERLTLVGFEVEEIQDLSTWAAGVVVGKIVSCERHPQAERLQVCQVDVGQGTDLTIVCGAANARLGLVVPVALEGTFLPIKGLTIQAAPLRGVMSQGMICSLAELGLAKQSEGVHEFTQEYPLGSDVRPLLGLDDVILDISSTANRADALSIVGIAREVAALSQGLLRLPIAEVPLIPQDGPGVQIGVSAACPAYIATVVTGLKLAPSPTWLIERLNRAGVRPINNIVDITNYVLLEWGQPLHAFDQARLGTKLGVRFARLGESLQTLDGVERVLSPQNLLITSDDQPVAIAGVMGGEATEVQPTTTTIVLEAALFDPAVVRRSARAQGLRTEASARYERGVDNSALEYALDRALSLLRELAGGEAVAQTRIDYRSQQRPQIQVRPSRIAQIMGSPVSPEQIEASLRAYGCDVTAQAGSYLVQVPGYRAGDLKGEIDLIEEIARWVGYERFPATLPQKSSLGRLAPEEPTLRQIRAVLRGAGLTELFHNTFTPLKPSPELASKRAQAEARFGQGLALVPILNPLAADYGALRGELLPGLLAAYRYNLDQGNRPLCGFELGRVFQPGTAAIQESEQLGGILGGDPTVGDWQKRGLAWDFFSAKGLLENLARALGLTFSYQPLTSDKRLHPGRTAALYLEGSYLGWLGQLHPRLMQQEDFPSATFAFELNLDLLTGRAPVLKFQPFSSYPALDRDMAFFCAKTIPLVDLLALIRQSAGDLLVSVDLFDEYTGQNVPPGLRSLAFRLVYRAADHTLTDAEVTTCQQRVREALVTQFQVQLRS